MKTQVRIWYTDGTAQVITIGGRINNREAAIAAVDVIDATLTTEERDWLIQHLKDHFTSRVEYRRVVYELYK